MKSLLFGILALTTVNAFAAHTETFDTSSSANQCGKAAVQATNKCKALEQRHFKSAQRNKIVFREVDFASEEMVTEYIGHTTVDKCDVRVTCIFHMSDL